MRPLQGRLNRLRLDPVALPPAIEFAPYGDVIDPLQGRFKSFTARSGGAATGY